MMMMMIENDTLTMETDLGPTVEQRRPARRASSVRNTMANVSLRAARAALTDDPAVHVEEIRTCRVLLAATEAEIRLGDIVEAAQQEVDEEIRDEIERARWDEDR